MTLKQLIYTLEFSKYEAVRRVVFWITCVAAFSPRIANGWVLVSLRCKNWQESCWVYSQIFFSSRTLSDYRQEWWVAGLAKIHEKWVCRFKPQRFDSDGLSGRKIIPVKAGTGTGKTTNEWAMKSLAYFKRLVAVFGGLKIFCRYLSLIKKSLLIERLLH